jgi:hypothetical protein
MRLGLEPTNFVLNNSRCTIEGFSHGPTRSSNDIADWYEYRLSPFVRRPHNVLRALATTSGPDTTEALKPFGWTKLSGFRGGCCLTGATWDSRFLMLSRTSFLLSR